MGPEVVSTAQKSGMITNAIFVLSSMSEDQVERHLTVLLLLHTKESQKARSGSSMPALGYESYANP